MSDGKVTRRDATLLAAAAAIGGAMVVEGKEVTDDEKDVAKETIAIFVASNGMGFEPSPEQVAERGKIAILAWRLLSKS